jgi:outer membrane protein assembly factor BamD
VGVEVLTPGVNSTPVSTGPGAASSVPAATGAADPNLGLNAVGPKNTAPLPPVEAPAEAPDQVNDVQGKQTPAADTRNPNQKKNPKPAFDKNDESSSKHKKKKGLDKVNPF